MSHVLKSSEMDEFFGILYELIRPMLASENCVKCIIRDGSITFTSDVEHLLSSLDIEHVAGELVIQALQSHKHTFGTGTKTLFFMIATLAKAVTQLRQLGISSEKSLRVIQKIFEDLSKEVEEICIVTQKKYLSNGANCPDMFPQTLATEKNGNPTAKSKQMAMFHSSQRHADQSDDELVYHCFDKEIQLLESNKILHDETICDLTGDKPREQRTAPYSANADPVILTMSNLQEDVEWFFDCDSSNQACSTNDIHKDDYGCTDMPECSSNCQNDLLCSGHQGCAEQSLSSIENGNNLKNVNIIATGKTLHSSYTSKPVLWSKDCNYNLASDIETPSVKDSAQYDIDFEDCFAETDEKQHFSEANKSIPSENKCKGDSVSSEKNISANIHVTNNHGADMFDTRCQSDIICNETSAQQLFHIPNCIKFFFGNEPHDSINNIDTMHSSKADESSLVFPYNACELPCTQLVCEVMHKSKEKYESFPADISNKLWDTSYLESMSGTDLVTAARQENMEEIRKFDDKSLRHLAQETEVKLLKAKLSLRETTKSQLNISTSSGHLQCTRNKSQQPVTLQNKILVNKIENKNAAKATDFCENSSLNLPAEIHCSANQEKTEDPEDKNCCEFSLTPNSGGNGQWDKPAYIICNVGNKNFSKKFSHVEYPNDMVDPALSLKTETVSEATDIMLKEQGTRNRVSEHKNNSKEMLLDNLLLQKKAQFRSSLGERVMTSSRHFYNSSKSDLSCTPPLHENNSLTQQTVNWTAADSCRLASDLNNTAPARDLEHSSKKPVPVLVHGSPFSALESKNDDEKKEKNDETLELSDFSLESYETGYNLCAETNSKSELTTDCPESSTFCHYERASCGFSKQTEYMKPHKVIACLHDCCGDVADAAMQIVQNQMEKTGKKRFNFDLVECLSIPSAASSVSVMSGLAIPCDNFVLEKLAMGGQPLKTLLVNADLDSYFHHKGYKPPLKKKTLIAQPNDGDRESDERLWCAKAFNIISHLNVKLVLVKGKASSFLLDMCEGAGVLILANISYHTLSVLSHLHRVDMVTYITLASEENLCSLSLVPLSAAWRDHLHKSQQNTAKYFALATNTLHVQTVVLHCSSTMSVQLAQERFWKCLHSIVNSQADTKVLPGGGSTEMWCIDRIQYKSESALASQSHVQTVILETVADIFRDYCQTIRQNTLHEIGQSPNYTQDSDFSPRLTGEKDTALASQCHSSISNFIPHQNVTMSVSEKDKGDIKYVSERDCLQNYCWKKVSDSFTSAFVSTVSTCRNESKQHSFPGLTNSAKTKESQKADHTKFSHLNHSLKDGHIYDNFQSKVSAWMTALDLVSVLHSLGCLVISGVDDRDITEDMALL